MVGKVGIGVTPNLGDDLLERLRDMQADIRASAPKTGNDKASGDREFLDYLRSSIQDVDAMQKTADKMAADLTSGKTENIHEVMLASTEAQLAFSMMVQVRNKALEAYQEVMRMQV